MMSDHRVQNISNRQTLTTAAVITRLGFIGTVLICVAGTFAYTGGFLSPRRLTQAQVMANFLSSLAVAIRASAGSTRKVYALLPGSRATGRQSRCQRLPYSSRAASRSWAVSPSPETWRSKQTSRQSCAAWPYASCCPALRNGVPA
jgi:hypothetical protein